MNRILWLLVLLCAPSSVMAQMMFPGPPSLTPPPVPNCPMTLMGVVNSVHYWITGVCPPASSPTGFGQSMTSVPTGCKLSDPTQCRSPVLLLPGNSPGMSIMKTGQFGLLACALPEGTPAELEDKLKEIRKESKKLKKYLEKLTKLGNSEISADRKSRIEEWTSYLPELIAYLDDSHASADSAAIKVQNYCTLVMTRFRECETAWSTVTHMPSNAPASAVKDDVLPVQLSAAEAKFTPQHDVEHSANSDKIWEVTVTDLPGAASKTVYFKTFVFHQKPTPPNPKRDWVMFGIQIKNPDAETLKKAKKAQLIDRNSFAHKLFFKGQNNQQETFLVSSFDDLSVAVDP